MKEKTTALIIVVIAFIMIIAINCSGSSPSDTPPTPDPVCECPDKEHEGECPPPCPGKGGENCDCTDPIIIEPEVCECTDKEHLGIGEDCCDREDCTCTLKVWGHIADNTHGNHFKIYRNGEVTDAEMAAAVANVIAGYARVGGANKNRLGGKIKEVWIIQEAADNVKKFDYEVVGNQVILKIQHDASSNAGNIFMFSAMNIDSWLSLAKAHQFDTAKETIRLAFGKVNGQRMI